MEKRTTLRFEPCKVLHLGADRELEEGRRLRERNKVEREKERESEGERGRERGKEEDN